MGFFISFFGLKQTIELINDKNKLMFSILRPYIFSLDPEVAHDLAIKSLKFNILPKSFLSVENEQILRNKFVK